MSCHVRMSCSTNSLSLHAIYIPVITDSDHKPSLYAGELLHMVPLMDIVV